jgi:hypothetical protein
MRIAGRPSGIGGLATGVDAARGIHLNLLSRSAEVLLAGDAVVVGVEVVGVARLRPEGGLASACEAKSAQSRSSPERSPRSSTMSCRRSRPILRRSSSSSRSPRSSRGVRLDVVSESGLSRCPWSVVVRGAVVGAVLSVLSVSLLSL